MWRLEWPQCVRDNLVSVENPDGTITHSDLDLAGGLLQLEAITQTFGIRERTVLSKEDTLNNTSGNAMAALRHSLSQRTSYACLDFTYDSTATATSLASTTYLANQMC